MEGVEEVEVATIEEMDNDMESIEESLGIIGGVVLEGAGGVLEGVGGVLKGVGGVLKSAELRLGAAEETLTTRLLDGRFGVISAVDEEGSAVMKTRLGLGLMSDWLTSEDEF